MGLPELKADIKLLRDQYATGSGDLDFRHELAENILPLMQQLMEGIAADQAELREEVGDLGEAVDDMIDETGDVLHPETTTKIVGLIEVGKLLGNELVALLAKCDDVTKKRVAQLVKTYRQGAEVVMSMLTEITMPVEPEDEATAAAAAAADEDDEEEDDDEDEDDDELEEGDEDEGDEAEDGTVTGGV